MVKIKATKLMPNQTNFKFKKGLISIGIFLRFPIVSRYFGLGFGVVMRFAKNRALSKVEGILYITSLNK